MPRKVDHGDRRRQIVQATVEVLGERGLAGLTIRAVAEQLGGSVTLVTHYYATREELIDDLANQLASTWNDDVADLDSGLADPHERLLALLLWAIPQGREELLLERVRIELLNARDTLPAARPLFEGWDAQMRGLFREHLRDLVAAERIEPTVDLLRAIVTGITLEAYQHDWSRERQERVLRDGLVALQLAPRAERAEG